MDTKLSSQEYENLYQFLEFWRKDDNVLAQSDAPIVSNIVAQSSPEAVKQNLRLLNLCLRRTLFNREIAEFIKASVSRDFDSEDFYAPLLWLYDIKDLLQAHYEQIVGTKIYKKEYVEDLVADTAWLEKDLMQLLGYWHQDAGSDDEIFQEIFSTYSAYELRQSVELIENYLLLPSSVSEKAQFVRENTHIYFPMLGKKVKDIAPVQWLQSVEDRLRKHIPSAES